MVFDDDFDFISETDSEGIIYDDEGIIYTEDTESIRTPGIIFLTILLSTIPIPLLFIAFIAGVSWVLGANSKLAFFVFFTLGILSWIAAPGIWHFKKYAFYLTLTGFVLSLIASSLSFFQYVLTGFWQPGEDFIYWAGNIEMAVYITGIVILLLNREKFLGFKKELEDEELLD